MRLVRGFSGAPADNSIYEDGIYTRAQVAYRPAPGHQLRAAVTPHFVARATESNLTVRTTSPRLNEGVLRLVSGIEYELNAVADALQNIAFVKAYHHRVSGEDFMALTNTVRERSFERTRFGFGDSLRYRFAKWVYAKASYEYATRLPNAEELFGNGALISANVALRPEVSHNANIGPRFELKRTPSGDFTIDLNAFMRDTRDLIVRIPGAVATANTNIGNARSVGVESFVGWVSPGLWLNLAGTYTYQDVRNTSETGPFAAYKGERIPSRPWMFASWGGGLRFGKLPRENDTLEPYYAGRYTRGYSRGWESVGDPQFWLRLPNMINHDVGITYTKMFDDYRVSASFSVLNLADARLFDTFGVERPGRAYYFKIAGDL